MNHPPRLDESNTHGEPGTLVWVGPKSHPEFADAFRFSLANSAQLAVRNHLQELVTRPAGFVRRVLIARPDRRPVPPCLSTHLIPRYRDAEFIALNSSLCDGEFRTGTPWDGIRNLRFSRWQEILPEWLSPCGYKSVPSKPWASLLLLMDRYETAEPYLDYAASLKRTAFWHRSYVPLTARNVDLVVWDDSVAPACSTSVWYERLAGVTSSSTRHRWLVTQPQSDEIQAALLAGIDSVHTKPAALSSLMN